MRGRINQILPNEDALGLPFFSVPFEYLLVQILQNFDLVTFVKTNIFEYFEKL